VQSLLNERIEIVERKAKERRKKSSEKTEFIFGARSF